MLGRPFNSIAPANNDKPAQLAFGDDEDYTADYLVRRRPPSSGPPERTVHRALVVLDRRIKLDLAAPPKNADDADDEEDSGAASIVQQAENALFVLPPSSLGGNMPNQPVFALMAGEGSFSAPPGQCKCWRAAMAKQ